MMIADGSARGKADPAFPAHSEVIGHWAQAIWNTWLPRYQLQINLSDASKRIDEAKQEWSVVCGLAAALVCTLRRVNWVIESATTVVIDEKGSNLTCV